MEVPETVRTAVDDRHVDGSVCLEAGAGAGNMSAALLDAGAEGVYAVTNDPDHAEDVRERFADEDRLTVLEGDLRETPLPDDSVDLVTAHALFGVVEPATAAEIVADLTRVARPGAHLVVDDYAPIPTDAPIRQLFAVENAAAELADARPALAFYPADGFRRLCRGYGWTHDRTKTLLAPVPWGEDLVDAHVDIVRETAAKLPEDLREALLTAAERRADAARNTSVGEMYSLALRLPEQ
jgi:SAM-dependent methyltransferase